MMLCSTECTGKPRESERGEQVLGDVGSPNRWRQATSADPAQLCQGVGHLGIHQPLSDLVAGLGLDDLLFPHGDALARLRGAALARPQLLDREGAKAADLYPAACRERIRDLVEDDVHQGLAVLLVEVRVLRRDAGDEFGSDHGQTGARSA